MVTGRQSSEATLRSLLLSRGRPRLWRHGLFWMLYSLYFYLQGISPDCVKGLDRSEVFYYAFTSAVCFLPGCAGCVYVFLYLLEPRFLKEKNYWGFFGGALGLFGGVVGVNYGFSLLFFRLSCHCAVLDIPAVRVFALGFLNSQNAMVAGGVALGAKLAARGYYQRKENLRLARLQAKARLGELKVKAQPEYLLSQLASIGAHIRAGATDPPAMILRLSDLLRYWLYERVEERSLLEEEPAMVPPSKPTKLPAFVYAERGPNRYYRHLLFWTARALFLMAAALVATGLLDDRYSFTLSNLLQCMTSLAIEIGYTYGLAYWLVPHFLRRRNYFAVIGLAMGFTAAVLVINGWVDRLWEDGPATHGLSFLDLWGSFWSYTGYGPPAVAAVFIVLKSIKGYARAMREKEALLMENAQAEALLLKAQVHPHFLFNTLNNIYSFSRRQPGVALQLIENLSSTLRYMSTECSADFVALEKELDLIRDYIELERVRYGDRLSVTLRVEGESGEKYIDPLLLIPLVENCFKHGASQLLEAPWIKVLIFIEGLVVRVEVSNNRPLAAPRAENKGIGLANVRKRLSLLHPGNHLLEIRRDEDRFLVRMEVPLRATITHSLHSYDPKINLSYR